MFHQLTPRTICRVVVACLAVAMLASIGCASKQKRDQLESVARDWCMTIRASQVIPVYPLTQDLQPGDVFLVQLPIAKQQQQYQQRGFLPLDNHLARLDVTAYADFYDASFLARPQETRTRLPADWMRPPSRSTAPWSMAPGAAFPTYAFSVNSGAGLSLAIPISGVPVGLSLLGADSAYGTVTIDDARTLGVDIMSLHEQLQQWVEQSPDRRDFLAAYGTPVSQPPRNFLRIVTRIYLTGKLQVSLHDASTRAAGADVGLARPIAGMLAQAPGTADTADVAGKNYEDVIKRLNDLLKDSQPAPGDSLVPGGSVRIAAASARSIAMSETFDPPLVIGYLGFDVPIHENGTLGNPIPTHALINGSITPPTGPQATLRSIAEPTIVKAMLDAISRDQSRAAMAIRQELDSLVRFIPRPTDAIRVDEADPAPDGTPRLIIKPTSFRAINIDSYLSYRANRDAYRRLLQSRDGVQVMTALADAPTLASDQDIQQALARLEETADERRAFRFARAALTEYYVRSTP